MANVYSIRLANSGSLAAGNNVLYTTPAGYVAVVRSISLWNPGVSLGGVDNFPGQLTGMILRTSSTGAIIAAIYKPDVRPQRLYHWDMHQVLNAAEQIYTSSSDAGWSVLVSGYQLTLP